MHAIALSAAFLHFAPLAALQLRCINRAFTRLVRPPLVQALTWSTEISCHAMGFLHLGQMRC